jgi:ATP-binding cassette subfamily B protein
MKNNYPTTLTSFFWQILKPYKWWIALMLQAPIIGAFFVPANNYALKLIVDELTSGQNFTFAQIIFPVALFCAASIILEIVWRIANFADYKSQPKIEAEILRQSYEMVLSHDYQFFQNNLSGKISSKVGSIMERYVYIFDTIHFGIISCSLSIFISLILLFFVHLKLALGVAFWLIIFMPLMFFAKKRGLILSERSTAQKQRLSGLVNDGISNISSVLFFGARNSELNLIENANGDFIDCEKKRLKFKFLNHLVMGVIYSALSISVLFLLIDLRQENLISTGDFVMVMGLMFYLIEVSYRLLNDVDNLIKDYGSLKESFTIFTQNHQVFDAPNALNLVVKNPEINFKNLTYHHQKDNLVFNDFNLSIKAGQRIGLVGHSGAGKSTLINLLLKVFDPINGEILIDGKNIADVTFDSLRENIALIPQDPMLFHRTIYENIAYGKINCHADEVVAAAQKAHIHDFIMSLPYTYDTLVGERGIKLSGGQKQRVVIARAILKNAPILILDEATSSLDSEVETQIQESINQMLETSKSTVIAIAHRLSTIKNMDRIVVMDKGKIIEDGSFAELISKENGRFRELWNHQVNGMIV